MKLADRLWPKVLRGGDDECWPFTGKRDPLGYGRIDNLLAHRVAFAVSKGIDLADLKLCVLHSCDNPPCCNPKHLHDGTRQQNSREAVERQRLRQGSKHPGAKLDEATVARMRQERAAGRSWSTLAAMFGLSRWGVRAVVAGVSWRRLPGAHQPQKRADVRGELHPSSKLTENLVKALRSDRATGLSWADLAAKYRLPVSTIRGAVNREKWRSVP